MSFPGFIKAFLTRCVTFPEIDKHCVFSHVCVVSSDSPTVSSLVGVPLLLDDVS